MIAICSRFCCPWGGGGGGVIDGPGGNYGSFLAWGQPFLDCVVGEGGGLAGCVQVRELGACARHAFRGLSCWEASETLYLWFSF